MPFEIRIPDSGEQAPTSPLVADRRLYVTEDRATLVEEGDARARYLFAAPGHGIPAADVARLSLVMHEGRVVQGDPADEPPADEPPADEPPADAPAAGRRTAKRPRGQ